MAAGIAGFMLLTMAAGCASTAKTTANTVPVPTVPGTTVPSASAPTTPATTATPQPNLASRYQADMVALTASPAWAIVEAQVAPENAYMTNLSGIAPSLTDAQLTTVTAEIQNVTTELNALAQNNEATLSSANTDADSEIQSVAIDMSTMATDVSSGLGIPGAINVSHKEDVQVRTRLQLPLAGPGVVGAVPEASI